MEKLNVYDVYTSADEIGNIKKHCKNLKSISLEGEAQYGEDAEIAHLLISYESQLEYALINGMSTYYLGEVVKACPNASFHLKHFPSDDPVDSLKLIGSRLKAISIYGCHSSNWDEWTKAWNECINLQELYNYQCNVMEAKAMFSTPKPHLTVMHLRFPQTYAPVSYTHLTLPTTSRV